MTAIDKADTTTVTDIMRLIERTQMSLREEGTWAHEADNLCVVVRADGSASLRLVQPMKPSTDEVFRKALSLDPEWDER